MALATNAVISGQGSGEIRKFIAEEGLPGDRLVAVKQLERITTYGLGYFNWTISRPTTKRTPF